MLETFCQSKLGRPSWPESHDPSTSFVYYASLRPTRLRLTKFEHCMDKHLRLQTKSMITVLHLRSINIKPWKFNNFFRYPFGTQGDPQRCCESMSRASRSASWGDCRIQNETLLLVKPESFCSPISLLHVTIRAPAAFSLSPPKWSSSWTVLKSQWGVCNVCKIREQKLCVLSKMVTCFKHTLNTHTVLPSTTQQTS